MSKIWQDLLCPYCSTEINPVNIQLAIMHDNLTTKHGSYRYFYYGCEQCDRKVVIHMFTEDKTGKELYV